MSDGQLLACIQSQPVRPIISLQELISVICEEVTSKLKDATYPDGIRRCVDKLHDSINTRRSCDRRPDRLDKRWHGAVCHGSTVVTRSSPQLGRPTATFTVVVAATSSVVERVDEARQT